MGPMEVVEEANDTTEGADLDEELAPDGTQLP
jgi:hypothetical protein